MGIDKCKLIDLPTVENPEGDLVFAEGEHHVPFPIARVYHIYGVPAGARRGGHAHRETEQLLICLKGSFEVAVDDGSRRETFWLSDPRVGLYLPRMIWRDLTDFADDSTYYVVASRHYDEADYVRDYEAFQDLARNVVANP